MSGLSAEVFTATLALVGVVVIVAALLSGLVERSGLPQVAVFLAIGAALGPAGLNLLHVALDSPILRVVATLSLVLVLFTDAMTIDLAWVRRHAALALRVLGPGTLFSAALIALAAWWLLALPPAGAAILGAALASTDPVLLRGLLRARGLPPGAREALRLESGLNDGVLLPIVLVAMAFLSLVQGGPPSAEGVPAADAGAAGWARLGVDLFLLGPAAGVGVALLSVAALDLVRRQIGVRRDYESLYSLGVALAAYAAAEAVHGSGFVAAFVAGLTIAYLDVELCDCFLEYGETTAEMALLFAFVLFGASLIWSGLAVLDGPTLAFAAVALLARPAVLFVSLLGSNLDLRSRLLVAWCGPRGLSSLLLVLLPVFAGLSGAERLFAVCSLVVLFSVVLHGGVPLLSAWGPRRPKEGAPIAGAVAAAAGTEDAAPAPPQPAALPPATSAGPGNGATEAGGPRGERVAQDTGRRPAGDGRITLDDVQRLQAAGQPVVLLDVRTERTFNRDPLLAAGAVRLPPDHLARRAADLGLDLDAWLIAYCA